MRRTLLLLALAACAPDRAPRKAPAASAAPATSKPAASAPRRRPHAPDFRPQLPTAPAADEAWRQAEAAPTPAAWDAAAEAFERAAHACATPDDCREAAYAGLLARNNAAEAEQLPPPAPDAPSTPLPPRRRALVDALDRYAHDAAPDDPDLGAIQFLAASNLHRYGQLDDAIPLLEATLRDHRDAETAVYAANVLLDALLRAGRQGELRSWVALLLADDAFLAGQDELRATLERLRDGG